MDQRVDMSNCHFDGKDYIRAHFWSTEGKYSSKTCLTLSEAQGYLATMKAKDGRK